MKVELYTHHTCVKQVFEAISKPTNPETDTDGDFEAKLAYNENSSDVDQLSGIDCRFCSIHLLDSYYCW